MDLKTMNEYVARQIKAKELDAESKRLKAENAKVEEQLIDAMIDANIKSLNIGDRTVFIRSQLWASAADVVNEITGEVMGKDWPGAVALLESHGYGELKEERVNSQRLSALIRELDNSEDGIPAEFEQGLKISEKIQLIVRK